MPANQMHSDPLDRFTDREPIVHVFEHTLRSAQPHQFQVLGIKGNSGSGKTFLISYLGRRICPKLGWQVGEIGFTQLGSPDFRAIVVALERALAGCVPHKSLKQYRNKQDKYNRRFDEYSATNTHQGIQIEIQLREREAQLRSKLSAALTELAEESTQPLCVFIDGYERFICTSQELVGWLFGELLPGLAAAIPLPFIVMICGQEWPGDAAVTPFTQLAELTDFDRAQVRSYLEKQGVIPNAVDLTHSEHEKLVTAFYELTKGHPLTLGLAATYFNELSSDQPRVESLQTKRPLVGDKARVEFLEECLLSRLPEPHCTVLRRAPILRSFDKTSLQVLLNVEIAGATSGTSMLDDRMYEHFLHYPFITRENSLDSSSLQLQQSFHDLVRRVHLEALCRDLPETKEQLHRKMAIYYWQRVNAEQELEDARVGRIPKERNVEGISRDAESEWQLEIPENGLGIWIEYFYHALQVRDLQADAFRAWEVVTGQTINRWRCWQAGPLLGVVLQVAEEGEPFLSKTSEPYGHYLTWYSRYLEQEARWEEALEVLKQAAKVLEQVGNPATTARVLNNIGYVYQQQGKLEQALHHYERTLALDEQVGDPASNAITLSNIGYVYQQQGKVEQAIEYLNRALSLYERLWGGFEMDVVEELETLATCYSALGKPEESSACKVRAQHIRKQIQHASKEQQGHNPRGTHSTT